MKKLLLAFALSLVPFINVSAQPSFETNSSARSQISLISPESKVNYTRLQNLLEKQEWREANDETYNLLLRASNRERQGWITIEDIKKLPCWDLATLDRLWTTYSNGHFGFTPQLRVFVSTGNRPGRLVAIEPYEAFGDQVGWRKNDDWIRFKENLNYSLDAPVGHLPSPRQEYQISGGRLDYVTLAQRIVECNVVSLPSLPTSPKPGNQLPKNLPR
ncbi:GUN4 domain-containing protein [Gloeothece verrucosa]|uniref:GUN4 domain protein n=1 Tax=Gloeothece verrucosa (strain PCC 7822) TaxID=497965 RepID=E0UCA0_GLOV7|nr:GUN4 domain-containing protein [Gloeothece verrucosa]ADN12857.1 GUN4 domain protein [Gloeothece verrucosa PCC 7822]